MGQFFVSPAGLNDLYNLLVRAAGDASDTLDYTKTHADLSWDAEGLLMMLMGPHEHAYENLTGALGRLRDLSQGAGTQVNLAQGSYARADQTAAERLDAGYPGAKNPASVRGTLAQGRPDLAPERAALSDVADPSGRLTGPEYATAVEMWSLNPMVDLVSPAAWLRQVSIWLFSFDPFEGWTKQFSGDWKAYTHCAYALQHVGAAAQDIGRNLTTGAADVATVWRGNAAEAEQEFQLALGGAAMALEPACAQYSQLYLQAAEATKSLFDVVSGLIMDLIDVLIIINISSAAGTALIETGVGAVAGYAIAAYYAYQAYDLYQEISKYYGNTEDLIKAIGGTISSIKANLAVGDLPAVPAYHHPGNP